jgi:predicted RNA-binding Zn ribbon-like protein
MESVLKSEVGSPGNFLFVGEHVALDFANTLLADNDGTPVETLNSCDDLLRWLVAAQLVTNAEKASLAAGLKSPVKQQSLLDQIRAFRALWKTNLERLTDGKAISAEFLKLINESLSEDHTWQVLSQETGARTFHIQTAHVPLEPTKKILALITNEIAHFLSSAKLEYLRRCAGTDCVVFFYDTTKSHRRQWCSMAICGNRHKVAKFRAREKTQL